MIPESKWKWYGLPLHFIGGHRCRFHLGTLIGEYVISTVGDYFGSDGQQAPIGYERWGETYVFRYDGYRDCGCPDIIATEIDGTSYAKEDRCTEMNAGHMEMCRKYAEMQDDNNA